MRLHTGYRRASGESLGEYVLIGALTLALAIPAVNMLGGSISSLLGQADRAAAADPMAAMTANTSSGGSGSLDMSMRYPENASIENFRMLYNAEGQNFRPYDDGLGEDMVSVSDAAAGTANSASGNGDLLITNPIQGTSLAAKSIADLAEMTNENGEPLPADLKAKILSLANNAEALARMQSEILNTPNPDAYYLDLAKQHGFLAYCYQSEILPMLSLYSSQLPADLYGKLSSYTGIASSITQQNFIQPAFNRGLLSDSQFTNPGEVKGSYGTAFDTNHIKMTDSPVLTHDASQKIDATTR